VRNNDAPRGLCITCIHVESRCWVRDDGEPILQCEQFDSGPSAEARSSARGVRSRERTGADYGDHIGLCMNCERRDDCTLPRPEGGVWHCEQYC